LEAYFTTQCQESRFQLKEEQFHQITLDFMKVFNSRSIITRFNLLLGAIVVVLFLALSFFLSFTKADEFRKIQLSGFKTLYSSIRKPLVDTVLKDDVVGLYKLLNTFCLEEMFHECSISRPSKDDVIVKSNFSNNFEYITQNIEIAGKKIGSLNVKMSAYTYTQALLNLWGVLPFLVILIVVVGFLFRFLLLKAIKDLNQLSQILASTNTSETLSILDSFKPKTIELQSVTQSIIQGLKSFNEFQIEKERMSLAKSQYEVFRQIAHDIRSPLEALKSITSEIDNMSFESRELVKRTIGRISDIASNLLRSNKDIDKEELINIRMMVEGLIDDKSFEYDIAINLLSDVAYNDCFSFINENELYRALSNIVNNAIEAQDLKSAQVEIHIRKEAKYVVIEVVDFGSGMNEVMINRVLAGGVTTKNKGNGLGLSYAKKIIDNANGVLTLSSQLGHGTRVQIKLCRSESPEWFVDNVLLHEGYSSIVCIDDDASFLKFYQNKLINLKREIVLLKPSDIDLFQIENKHLFFVDYDLGINLTGFDFIVNNKIQNRSYLVTSMFQDKELIVKCIENGVKIIPKQLFDKINISFLGTDLSSKTKYILIDDDQLIHMMWQARAEEVNVEVECFDSIDDFFENVSRLDLNAKVYLDSNLKDVKGEEHAERIAQAGFSHLYLSTGYDRSHFENLPACITDIVTKEVPF